MAGLPEAAPRANLEELVARHRRAFRERFGPGPEPRCFFAPGRVNLMGAHLDYNGGPVMPMTVHCGTVIAARPRTDRRIRMASTLEPEEVEVELAAVPAVRAGAWSDYPLGVLRSLGAAAEADCGVDLLFGGNLPIGAGLSSSASICVAFAFAVDALWGLERDRTELVDAALWAEREFVGVQCGIMDPFAVGYARPGCLLWLDCKNASIEHLPLDWDAVEIAVADTGVRRSLARGAFNERVRECAAAFEVLRSYAHGAACLRDVSRGVLEAHGDVLPPAIARRARHVVDEVERTFVARKALRESDLERFGSQMAAAHTSLRELFEVSVPELDCLVDAALAQEGVLGARLTGAGFGGCVVILVRRGAREGLAGALGAAFGRRFGRAPELSFFEADPGPREIRAS